MENNNQRRRRTERMQYNQQSDAPLPNNGSLPNANGHKDWYTEGYGASGVPIQGGMPAGYQPQSGVQGYYQQPVQGGQRINPQAASNQQAYAQGSQQVFPAGYYAQDAWQQSARQMVYPPSYGGGQPAQVYPPVTQQTKNGAGGGAGKQPKHPSQPPKPPIWKNRLFRLMVLGLALVAVIVIVVMNMNARKVAQERAALQAAVHSYDELFCQGVYVNGVHLGGMTQREAMDTVQSNAQEKRDEWSVTLQYGDNTWLLNAQRLGMQINIASALDAAWAQGHYGTTAERKQQMDALGQEPFFAYTSLSDGDTSVVDLLLEEIAASINRPVENASIESFNANLTYPFTFHNEQNGVEMDVESVREQVYELVSTMTSATVNIEPKIIAPSVTVEDIKRTQLSVRGEAMTEISTTSTENRNDNIRRSFELISGTILKPNEVFSFNGVVGKRSKENGFKEAIEYQNGKEVNAIGGGVCQSSTTLYQAAVRAGLEIVKREPHSLQVGYSDYGMDATVYWEYGRQIDFQFRNNTGSSLYIKAVVEWSKAANRWVTHVTYYGEPLPSGVRYDFAVHQETIPAPAEPKIVQDKKGEYAVYTDEQVETQKAKDGVRVTSYRVMYQDGHEVLRDYLDTDEYPPKQQVIYVGVKEYR